MTTASEHSLYLPGTTPLHQADPRLKVLSSLLLVMLSFAASGWAQLFTAGAAVCLAALLTGPVVGALWRLCWMLRWLLLLTLSMHLLLSPGRTLLGTSWLSLDGLLTGLFVCMQMVAAVAASALLALTTSPACLAGSFGWFVRPLRRFGWRTDEWQKLVLLSMDFIPMIREELHTAFTAGTDDGQASSVAQAARWHAWSEKLHALILSLVARADIVAQRLAEDGDSPARTTPLPRLLPLAVRDRWLLALLGALITCYWILG